MTPTELQLTSDTDLVNELLSRFDVGIFYAERIDNHDASKTDSRLCLKGSYSSTIGLCRMVECRIQETYLREVVRGEEQP